MRNTNVPAAHQIFQSEREPARVLPDDFLTWVHGSASSLHFYSNYSMHRPLAELLINDREKNCATWTSSAQLKNYAKTNEPLQKLAAQATSDIQGLLAITEQAAYYDGYVDRIEELPRGTQAAKFHTWAEERMGHRELDRIYRSSIGHGGCPLFDHGFIADHFPSWGREMFEEHRVESVLIGQPYIPMDEVERWVDRLVRNGFKVWIRDFRWHYEGVTTTIIAAADEIEIPSKVLHSTEVAGRLHLCDFRGFWPSDRTVVTEIAESEPYTPFYCTSVGWSALLP